MSQAQAQTIAQQVADLHTKAIRLIGLKRNIGAAAACLTKARRLLGQLQAAGVTA